MKETIHNQLFFQLLFLVFIFFFLFEDHELMVMGQNTTRDDVFKVGVILDFVCIVGKMGWTSISMALSDFYPSTNNNSSHKRKMVLHTRDSNRDIVDAASAETAFTTTTTMAKIKKWDVYSYGVVLLELITRKKALDPSFPEDTETTKWVRSTWNSHEAIEVIVDPSLIDEFLDSGIMDEVIKVMLVALQCTSKDLSERPTMRDVVKKLKDAKVIIRSKSSK